MKVISSFITKGSISRKVVGKKPNGKSYLPDVLKEQIPAILKALNASVSRQTKKNFFDTKVTLLYDNLIDEDIDNAETSINFDIDGYNKSDGNVADLDDIFDEISYKTIKADVNKVLKNGVKVLDVYDGGYLGSIIEFKVSKPKKVTGSLKTKTGSGMKQKVYTEILMDKLNVNPRSIKGPIEESLTLDKADPKVKAVYDTAVDIVKTELDTSKIDEAALFVAVNDVLDRKYGNIIEWE